MLKYLFSLNVFMPVIFPYWWSGPVWASNENISNFYAEKAKGEDVGGDISKGISSGLKWALIIGAGYLLYKVAK